MKEPPPANDEASIRQRRAADPVASVWVAASAGSGKTKVLTDRVLRLLLTGSPPDRLLCLTFTRAAAAEMAGRIASRLAAWATADDGDLDRHLAELLGRTAERYELDRARRLFFVALDAPGGLKIQTIHGFCQSLLARFPLEAGTAPDFRVLTERDSRQLLRDALLTTVRAAEREGGRLAEALAAVTWRLTESDLLDEIRGLIREQPRVAACIADYGSVDAAEAALRERLGLAPGETEDTIVAGAVADGAFDSAALRSAVAALASGTETDRKRGQQIAPWLAAGAADRVAGFDDYLDAFIKLDAKPLPAIHGRLMTKAPAARAPGALAALEDEAERLLAVTLRRLDARLVETSAAMLRIGSRIIATLAATKAARGLVDFDDMIAAARRLLLDADAGAWVHFKLDGGLDHVLIDEAQDTSREQWDIVKSLSEEFFAGEGAREVDRTVFAVGDIKQSIFSFQGAEPQQFLDNRDAFAAASANAHKPWHDVELPTSFRSTAAVLAAVDAVFAASPARDGVALDGRPIRHEVGPNRIGHGGSVELWPPLVTPKADEEEDSGGASSPGSEEPPQRRMARLLADRIAAMTGGGETLPARGRPIRPGDIMVLVRRRTLFVEALVRDLKDRGVPVAGVDRMTLMEQLAVMDLLAIGRFVLLPEDDLTLAVVLKGPLIGLDDDALFAVAHGRDGSLWQALGSAAAAGDTVLAAARQTLEALLARADLITPFAFFSEVLSAGGGRHRWLARLGPEADEPIAEFLHLALEFEAAHPPSMQGFLAWMDAGRDIEIKRDLEQAPGAVRIITVHGAKGLQAPVVILPDTLQVPKPRHRLVWLVDGGKPPLPLWAPRLDDAGAVFRAGLDPLRQADDEEYRRLLYVAMTRAEDRLIVCGWRDRNRSKDPEECWYKLIEGGLHRLVAAEMTLEAIDDSLLARSGAFPDGAKVLTLSCPQTIAIDAAPLGAADEVPPLPDWARTSAPGEPLPPLPLVPSRADAEPTVRPPLDGAGGSGLKRGRLVHQLLQYLPALPPGQRAGAAARWLDRPVHGLSPRERDELLAETLAVLTAPQAAPLFGPGSLAEVPVAGVVGGRLIAGQVDRLLVTTERVVILDYKTDRPPPLREEEVPPAYLRQMAAYRAALARVYPDRGVDCLLLWTCGPRLMVLDGRRLDDHAPAVPVDA